MSEQLGLFADENILFNTGLQRLLEMDFGGCIQTLQRYKDFYPCGRDVTSVMEVALFLRTRLHQINWNRMDMADAERCYRVWLEFESTLGYPWKTGSLEENLQIGYFSRLANGLAAGGYSKATTIPSDVPMGLIYLLAHRPDDAIASLQALIAEAPEKENARVYGYLGDAYLLQSDLRAARICYREAFVMAPDQVDLMRLKDREIKERIEDVGQGEELDGDTLDWFLVRAQLDGIFEPRVLRDLGSLRHWINRYSNLLNAYTKREDKALLPRLFYHAMVLSDNAEILQHVKKVKLVEIRQMMKTWQPALFAKYMRLLALAK